MRPVILDTDIGTDVDDLLALVLLAKAAEIQFCGVTTVHGDTILRAKIARVACDLLGRREVAVAAGESNTLANRPIFWAGHEGEGIDGLDDANINSKVSAEEFLIQSARKFAGDICGLGEGRSAFPTATLQQSTTEPGPRAPPLRRQFSCSLPGPAPD
jgi:purine nucleosidase